jgi:coenzyme F420-reducing hydrogenase delta subunit
MENEHFSEHTFPQATIKASTTTNSVALEGAYALLYEKVKGLKCGEVCIYHSGSLAADRLRNEQLNTLARLLMVERKRIRLCQRRLAEGCYDYLAVGVE